MVYPRRLASFIEALIVIGAFTLAIVPLPLGPAYLSLIDPAHGIGASAKASELLTTRVIAPGVPGSALVAWDKYGIPHIYATTDEAGFYALGWVEAGLRLFQMDLLRRIPEGRLAGLIGPQALPSDRIVIKLGVPDAVKKQALASLRDPALREMNELVRYFILGINDYINYVNSHDMVPLEYRLLGQKPSTWNYTDVFAVSKLPALLYSFSESDLVLEKLVQKWGPGLLLHLGIGHAWPPYTAYCNESKRWSPGPTPLSPPMYNPSRAPGVGRALENLEPLEEWLRIVTGGEPASSAFVVNPAFTTDHGTLLVDDLHDSLTAPPLWLIVQLVTPSFHVAGLVLPGTPFVFVGRNLFVAWGFTSSMADQIDFYYFKWNSRGEYLFNGTWHKPVERKVQVKVWNPLKRRYTVVIVNVTDTLVGPLIGYGNESYAVKWTFYYSSNELAFLWRLNMARDYKDALRAQLTLGTPLLNLFVADTGGHIAWSPVGYLPLRANLPLIEYHGLEAVNTGFLPFNASAGQGLWVGIIPKTSLRVVVDPRRPFLANANNAPFLGNCTIPSGRIIYGYEYSSGYRAKRLFELVKSYIARPLGINVSGAEAILNDTVDLGLLEYTRLLVGLASAVPAKLTPLEAKVISSLMTWRGDTSLNSTMSTIALAWTSLYTKELWSHLLGGNYSGALEGARLRWTITLLKAYSNGDEWVYDYLNKGYPEELAVSTLSDAIQILEEFYGSKNVSSWRYGRFHYYQPRSPLGWLLPGLNLERVSAPGGPDSVLLARPSEVDATRGAPVGVASVARVICDLGSSKMLVSIPGGESGSPFSPHYSDLYRIWARGGYVSIDLTAKPPSSGARLVINAWG
ncbi:MAG: penicillin acylase family protein [Desulfurococcales archaeon]|nr:penicillin acylase family protein [Desulfurococcales archaeon]